MKRVYIIYSFIIIILIISIIIMSDSGNKEHNSKENLYFGKSVSFSTLETESNESLDQNELKKRLNSISDNISSIEINNEYERKLDELLTINSYLKITTKGNENHINNRELYVSEPIIYLDKETDTYLVLAYFYWNKEEEGIPYWKYIETTNKNSYIAGIFDSFQIEIQSLENNELEVVNSVSFLKVFNLANNQMVLQNPSMINTDGVKFVGADSIFESDGNIDYSWNSGLLIIFYKNLNGITDYQIQAKYTNKYL